MAPLKTTWCVFLAAVLSAPHHAEASNLEHCDAVQSVSAIGYWDYDTVTITANIDQKECRFSVNGAKSGSPPQQMIMDALQKTTGTIDERSQFMSADNLDYHALAVSLLAAGPDENADQMQSLLSEFEETLASCRNELIYEKFNGFSQTDQQVMCGSFGPGASGTLYEIGPFRNEVQGELEAPRLVFVVQRGAIWNLLSFAPR